MRILNIFKTPVRTKEGEKEPLPSVPVLIELFETIEDDEEQHLTPTEEDETTEELEPTEDGEEQSPTEKNETDEELEAKEGEEEVLVQRGV